VDAVARRTELWEKVTAQPSLVGRTTQRRRAPHPVLAQLFYTFTSGGNLDDTGRVGLDPLLCELLGFEGRAGEGEVRAWLGAQNDDTVKALREVNAGLVKALLELAPPERLHQDKQLDVFFTTRRLQARPCWHHEPWALVYATPALCLPTLWAGPFWLDATLHQIVSGQSSDYAGHQLAAILEIHRDLWRKWPACFYAGSSCSEDEYLQAIAAAGFAGWSVTLNKEKGDRLDAKVDAEPARFRQLADAPDPAFDAYRMLYQDPPLAVGRRKARGDAPWRYSYLVLSPGVKDDARGFLSRHACIDRKEQALDDLLADFVLEQPPCAELAANRVFYGVVMLAFNILTGLKILALPDEAQGWRMRRLQHELLLTPFKKAFHGGLYSRRVAVPKRWGPMYATLLDGWQPRRKLRGSGSNRPGPTG
jgi:hypothetical protein